MQETLADRVERLMNERGLTRAELARRSGLHVKTVGTFLLRAKSGHQRGVKAETAKRIAAGLGVPAEQVLGAQEASPEILFKEFVRWAHENVAVASMLTLHGDNVTVGDLLRYRASPLAKGEFAADDVWNHIVELRRGLGTGTDVAEEDESKVGPKRKKR